MKPVYNRENDEKAGLLLMEWNFLFRIDHLNEKGEERNLKGLVFTEGSAPPTSNQILQFLQKSGYDVSIHDPEQLIFMDNNPKDPVKITIMKLNREEEEYSQDQVLKLLAEQFRTR
jgi:hypothetical protein